MTMSRDPAGRRRHGAAVALLLALLPIRQPAALEARDTAPGASATAGTVLVTAGEHGEFSRVVFALGTGVGYRAEPEPEGLRVVFPGARLGFDYDAVYPARRAHRVVMAESGYDSDGASFRLRFGCDCSARTFMLDGRLVVDVFDSASRRQPAGSRRAEPADRIGATSLPEPPAQAAADSAPPQDLLDASGQRQPRSEFLQRVQNLDSPAPGAWPSGATDGPGFDSDHLERMVAWAVEQGLLTKTQQNDRAEAGPASPRRPEALADPGAALGAAGSAARVEQRTPVAEESPAGSAPSATSEARDAGAGPTNACPDDSGLDMAVLGGSGAFAAELARRQDALSRALTADDGVAQARHGLAGFYLARSMPHEALQLLRSADREQPTPTGEWLEAIGLVLADRTSALQVPATPACSGANVELWQAVLDAADGPLTRSTLERDGILLRLAAYPPALRVELALRLAEAGVHAQAPEAIARLLDLVEQAAPAEEARARLLYLRGRLAAARGDFAGAHATWREAVALPGEGSLRATLALLQSELDEGMLDEAWALPVLERLAYDWRGHAAQLNIARLTAGIYERQGRVPLALRAIEEVVLGAEGQPAARAAARLATDLMRRTYAHAPSDLAVEQLAVAWRYEGFVPPGLEGADLRLAFAQAMIGHGLPNAATNLLQPLVRDASDPAPDRVVALLVESYLATNQPARAVDLLRAAAVDSSVAKPGRNLLAARVLAALGRFAEAAGILHDAAGEEAARLRADYLWKAGMWRETTTAYRELLRKPAQASDSESAARLAAAAYMTDAPELLERVRRAAEASDPEVDMAAFAAFAPSPTPDRSAERANAPRLIEQAASLSELAERYGVGGTP